MIVKYSLIQYLRITFVWSSTHLAAGCEAPLLAPPPPRRQPPLRHVRPVPEAAVPPRPRRGAAVVGASVRSIVGMETDKEMISMHWYPIQLIYLLCSFHSLFLMWVILVQAASVTLGFTFQGSWQPEMTPVWNQIYTLNIAFGWVQQLIKTSAPVVVSTLLTRSLFSAEWGKMVLVENKQVLMVFPRTKLLIPLLRKPDVKLASISIYWLTDYLAWCHPPGRTGIFQPHEDKLTLDPFEMLRLGLKSSQEQFWKKICTLHTFIRSLISLLHLIE